MNNLIDLTYVIENEMPVYPGDCKTSLLQTNFLDKDKYNNHRLDIGMHSGTHIDGPMHLTESNEYISELPLEAFIAQGCILDVRNQPVIKMNAGYEKQIEDNSIVLLYTGMDRYYGKPEYYNQHPIVDMDFCKFLLKKKVKMLGVDMPSPDRFPFEIHKFLLNNKIYILENLTNLDKLVGIQSFEVMALPLKIKADASMARVVARVK